MSEKNKYEQALELYNTTLNDAQVAAEVARIVNEKVPENDTPEVKKFLMGSIELTTLKTTDSDQSVMKFTQRVNDFDNDYPQLPHVATICVYPRFAAVVSDTLQVEGVEVACVSGSFPSSQALIEVKVAETALALKDGATEIDMVMSVGAFLSGDYETVCDEIRELKAVCGERKLKVILEKPAATPEAAYVMCHAIKEYYEKTGIQVGFKPAGGLNTVHDALIYYTIVKEVLGEQWLTNQWLRLGTSRLANLLLSEVTGEEVKYF